jgi:hypothetical protein
MILGWIELIENGCIAGKDMYWKVGSTYGREVCD